MVEFLIFYYVFSIIVIGSLWYHDDIGVINKIIFVVLSPILFPVTIGLALDKIAKL